MSAGPLHLAVDLDGTGDVASLRRTVAAAEAAGFALATFSDAPTPPADGVRLEAGVRAAHVAVLTDRLGLAPELHVTTTEPFHLATQLASLDHASRGRGAWLVGAAADPGALSTVGAGPRTSEAVRQEVADVVDVACLLWDSWQDDAVIRDATTGRYLDSGRVHHVDFEGATFSVKGPLITPRPPQGQLVVVLPGHLDLDERVDVVLVTEGDVDAVADRARRARGRGAPLVFADVEVVLDAPADLPAARPAQGIRHVGPASGLVTLLRGLAGVVDGVRLLPAVPAVDLPVLAEQVVPALAAAGLHRPPTPGATLRRTLGLPHPANRFITSTRTEGRA